MSLRSELSVVMFVTIFLAYSGVQHILCCVFVVFFFAYVASCHLWLFLRYYLTFIRKKSRRIVTVKILFFLLPQA